MIVIIAQSSCSASLKSSYVWLSLSYLPVYFGIILYPVALDLNPIHGPCVFHLIAIVERGGEGRGEERRGGREGRGELYNGCIPEYLLISLK